jgi:hypothetical protein
MTVDRNPQWKTAAPIPSQLTEIRSTLDQLWTKCQMLQEFADAASGLLNENISQSKLVAIIKAINGHTSAMPDNNGENEDHDARYATLAKLFTYLKKPTATDPLKIGGTANHIQIDINGNLTLVGDATQWDDGSGNLIGKRLESPSSHIVQNNAEGTMDFDTSTTLSDYVIVGIQRQHSWKLGSTIFPHLHWFQASATMPNWLIQYRWQRNGQAKTTGWESQEWTANVFTYSAGTLCQITEFGTIVPPADYAMSDVLQYRILRDTNNDSGLFSDVDALGATVAALSFDDHYEKNSFGSNTEYVK